MPNTREPHAAHEHTKLWVRSLASLSRAVQAATAADKPKPSPEPASR